VSLLELSTFWSKPVGWLEFSLFGYSNKLMLLQLQLISLSIYGSGSTIFFFDNNSNIYGLYILRKQLYYKTTLERRLDHIKTPGGASDTYTSTRHTRTVVGRHVYWSRRSAIVVTREERNAGEGNQRRHGRPRWASVKQGQGRPWSRTSPAELR
jgi:hypothetical protein